MLSKIETNLEELIQNHLPLGYVDSGGGGGGGGWQTKESHLNDSMSLSLA